MDLTAVLADPSFLDIMNDSPRSGHEEEFSGSDGTPHRVARRLPSKQVDALVDSYVRGASTAEIATDLEIAKTTVLQHLQRREVPPRPYRKVHGELFERAVLLYEAGGSLRSVSKELGVTRGALTDAFRLAGVGIRTR